MKVTIATKKIGETWEGALVVDQRFQRALTSDKLEDLILRGLVGVLAATKDAVDGTDVVFDIAVDQPKDAGGPHPA